MHNTEFLLQAHLVKVAYIWLLREPKRKIMSFVRTFNSQSCSVLCTAVMLMTGTHSCSTYNVFLYEKDIHIHP